MTVDKPFLSEERTNVLSDEEFYRICAEYDDEEFTHSFKTSNFTPTQIVELCHQAIELRSIRDLEYVKLESHHIDILVTSPYFMDKKAILAQYPTLTISQLKEILVNEEAWRVPIENQVFAHPCCTDELKVWYHLTYGNGGVSF